MSHDEYVAAIARDGAALGDAARDAGLDAPVPSCPGWIVADLVAHQGRIHRWVTEICASPPDRAPEWWDAIDAPGAGGLLEWFAAGADGLVGALAAAGADRAVWSWTSDRTTGFWARRMANESAVHRWDAQRAVPGAVPDPIAPRQAVDAIDEVFTVLPYRRRPVRVPGAGETIHLHCTDTEGEWLVRLDADELVVTREHAKGDVAARGSASDLLLFVLGRVAPDALEVFGDGALLERWQREAQW